MEVQAKQGKFSEVKKYLQRLHLQYAMLYPAWLQVTARGQAHCFNTALDVSSWLDANEASLINQQPRAVEI